MNQSRYAYVNILCMYNIMKELYTKFIA